MKLKYSTSGFTLIELIIGMTIFSIGLTGIYALLQTTISTVRYSRDEIIVSGLLREQIDLVMNMRDTNLRNYIPWDSVHVEPPGTQTLFASGIYMIENDFTTPTIVIDSTNGHINKSPIKLTKVDSFPTTDEAKWQKTQIHMDDKWRYIHSETIGTPTQYGSYIIITPLIVDGAEVKKDWKNQWWIIDARVLIKLNGSIREYDTKSMITDWQK
jgi:prepilin-type N-terminal cleavage/methylation domain-containing protein